MASGGLENAVVHGKHRSGEAPSGHGRGTPADGLFARRRAGGRALRRRRAGASDAGSGAAAAVAGRHVLLIPEMEQGPVNAPYWFNR